MCSCSDSSDTSVANLGYVEARRDWCATDTGLRAIVSGGGHVALWATLEAWAGQARDPDAWEARVISRAQAGPEALTNVERGQVSHVVSTEPGARRFARAAAPADWLCVFDPAIRYGTPSKDADSELTVDPFNSYGLDDDSPPAPLDPNRGLFAERRPPGEAWDAFALSADDKAALAPEHVSALRGYASVNASRLPPRLHWLALWISEVCDQPAAAWWGAGQRGLHSDLQKLISLHFERLATAPTTITEEAWRYLFRAWNGSGKRHTGEHDLAAEISRMGWSTETVRAWSRLLSPRLNVRRAFRHNKPPSTGPDIERNQIVDVEIEYPKTQVHFPIPDDHLALAAAEIRHSLELGIDLETELRGFEGLPIPPIERDPQLIGEDFQRTYRIATLFFIYVGLLERLIANDAAAVRRETAVWRESSALFSRLRIWAAGRSDLLGPVEAAKVLLSLDDDVFWDLYGQRDLLLVLSRRWGGLPDRRRRLEKRLLHGPPRRKGKESSREYSERRAHSILGRLIWLRDRGCAFAFDLEAKLAELRGRAPGWRDEYGSNAARSLEGRGGWIGRDLDPRGLEGEPPATLFTRAAQLGGREYDRMVERQPLAGLAEVKPVRFLRALVLAEKRGDPAIGAWETFLNAEARLKDRRRLMWAIARRVARLSTYVLSQIARPVSDWILRLATPLQQEPREPFEALWSALLRALRKHPEATESGLISSSAIDWANHALNSPIGNLAQALMKDESLESSAGPFLPSWLSKVESLLGITGDAHRDALVIFSHQLVWIYGRAPDWAEAHLLSVLGHDREDERAFWSGFFWAAQIPGFELYARLKPFLLVMVSPERNRSSDVEKIAGMLLAGWGSFDTIQGGERCVSNDEMRQALRAGGDDFRVQVLWHLKTWSKEGGSADQALVLLRDVWPRERAVRTEETSAGLFDLAIDTDGDMFTLLVDAVTPLMTTLSSSTLGLVELMRGADEELVREPMALLKLLYAALAQSATDWPYHADSVIERLAFNPATAHDPRMAELRRRLAAR
jgi:hypothetical protein